MYDCRKFFIDGAWVTPAGRRELDVINPATEQPIGKISLNYGRITDTVIDNALKTLRENADPKARKAAALAIGKRFTAQQYAL